MALPDAQRYPSYWHSSTVSSPHWDRKVSTNSSKTSSEHSRNSKTPHANNSPRTPTNLRQTLLNFSPKTEPETQSPHKEKTTKVESEQVDLHPTISDEKSSEVTRTESALPLESSFDASSVKLVSAQAQKRSVARRKQNETQEILSSSQAETSKPSKSREKPAAPKKNSKRDAEFRDSTGKRQTQLTNYGIRRTARQFQKDQEKERERNVLTLLRENTETGMKIILTEDKGRGIIATRTFHEGEFVVEYAGELIAEKLAKEREVEYRRDASIGSYMFYFIHNGQKWCVDATKETPRLGRLINHSRLHPNCLVKVIPLDGVPRLVLFAKQTINPGEELLYDYGDRDKETLEAHPWLKT